MSPPDLATPDLTMSVGDDLTLSADAASRPDLGIADAQMGDLAMKNRDLAANDGAAVQDLATDDAAKAADLVARPRDLAMADAFMLVEKNPGCDCAVGHRPRPAPAPLALVAIFLIALVARRRREA